GIDYHAPAAKTKPGDKQSIFNAEAKVREYAQSLLSGLEPALNHPAFRDQPLQLLIEPGRFLVAQAGALVTQVLYVKQNGKKTFVITDAAMNDLIRPALYQAHHEIVPVTPSPGPKRAVDIVGPVCETGDFFARDRKLSSVQPGDLLAILDAGAYGMAQSSNYNSRTRPAEVLLRGKKATLIRRRETTADLLAPELP
ncbi:MAG TPA: diaminopimelate decarboxylase, partial [Acidobacteriaceae bacterium]